MSTVGKFRNEDLSVFFFVKMLTINGKPLYQVVNKVVDGYPFTDIESSTLQVPCVAIEHVYTADGAGEMGSSWFRRSWEVTIFAETDTQRDDLSDRIFQALDGVIPVRDYSGGFNRDTGKSLIGTDLRIIENILPEDRMMRPTYSFSLFQKITYWRTTITFDTVSTQAG